MAVLEGATKMQLVGRWILVVSVGLWILLALFSIATATHLIVLAIAPGAFLWLAGWILERFVKTIS